MCTAVVVVVVVYVCVCFFSFFSRVCGFHLRSARAFNFQFNIMLYVCFFQFLPIFSLHFTALVELYVVFILLGHKSFDASSLFAASMQSTRHKKDRLSDESYSTVKKSSHRLAVLHREREGERVTKRAQERKLTKTQSQKKTRRMVVCTSFSSVVRIKSNEKC